MTRTYQWTDEQNLKRSKSTLGKNAKNGKLRDYPVTFIAPDGTVYDNVKNMAKFAREHGLAQSALNNAARYFVQDATRKARHHRGWRLVGVSLTDAKNLPDELRPLRTIRNPQGQLYTTRNIQIFEEEHKCDCYDASKHRYTKSVRTSSPAINEMGQAWILQSHRLVTLYTVEDVQSGLIYPNILAPIQLGRYIGIPDGTFRAHWYQHRQNNATQIRILNIEQW